MQVDWHAFIATCYKLKLKNRIPMDELSGYKELR
jgi:hypothetical protein